MRTQEQIAVELARHQRALAGLHPGDVTWGVVRGYAQACIAAYTDRCVDVATPVGERAALAVRIDELKRLCAPSTVIGAPIETPVDYPAGGY